MSAGVQRNREEDGRGDWVMPVDIWLLITYVVAHRIGIWRVLTLSLIHISYANAYASGEPAMFARAAMAPASGLSSTKTHNTSTSRFIPIGYPSGILIYAHRQSDRINLGKWGSEYKILLSSLSIL